MNSNLISWISQQGMDISMLMDQCDFVDSFDDQNFAAVCGTEYQNYLSPASNSVASSSTVITIPGSGSNSMYTSPGMEQQTPDNYSKFSNIQALCTNNPDQASSAPNPIILSFGNQNPPQHVQQANAMVPNPGELEFAIPEVFKSPSISNVKSDEAMPRVQPTKKKRIRPPSQTYDHIIAERKRREQLSQLFVALSALVPGLKKMDKSSILEDAIKYMKLLQEKMKILEEKAAKKAMESVVIKKSQIVVDDEDSSDEQSCNFDEQPLPDIEARVCDNHILLKIHCEKQKGVLVKLICKVESLNMIVVNTNATPFGDVALDITIVAEMEKEFDMTVKEVVTAIRAAF